MQGEQKITQMLLEVAAQFIELVASEEERQTHLGIACAAWNLSILPKSKRNKEYNKYVAEIRRQIDDKETMDHFKKDLRIIIKKDLNGLMAAKLKLYPTEKKPIISAQLENLDDVHYRVTATFARSDHSL